VGLPKTGTTSIQRYLVRHAPQLRKAGIAFPFDLSRRPKDADGDPIGVPQIESASPKLTGPSFFQNAEAGRPDHIDRLGTGTL
jgi:hypothetical protein